jgi:hypothetical protein
MQKQANLDYVQKRKKAFSPPPGASMHEAGRAMDIDLSSIGVPLSRFWDIAGAHGFRPIIPKPVAGVSESWHFDLPGSHWAVYQYAKSGKPYAQMARSAILAIGVHVDLVADQGIAALQSGLIRLGFDPGPIDGCFGERTKSELRAAGCQLDQPEIRLNELLRAKFPAEHA